MHRKTLKLKCWKCKTRRTFHLLDEAVCPKCGAGREWIPQLELMLKLQLEALEELEKTKPLQGYKHVLFDCRKCGLVSVIRVKERLKCRKCKKPIQYKCWNCKQPIKQPFHICSQKHWFICQNCGACCCKKPRFSRG